MTGIGAAQFKSLASMVGAALLFALAADAREHDWYLYENSHFVAYSNESEKTVTKLLTELEYFRAAVLQVGNIDAIEDAPKATVVLFRTIREFHKLIGSNRIGGLASSETGALTMLLAASGSSKLTKIVLRHEYAHVILSYKKFPYPMWFNEGFAELLSATAIRKGNSQFTVGDDPGRRRSERRLTPWSAILASDFNPHGFSSIGRASDAYLQSWFLVHYFMLNDDPEVHGQLVDYLARYAMGQDSVSAFEAAVGMSADDFGNKLLREYVGNYYVYDFQEPNVDLRFLRETIDAATLAPVIEPFRDRYKLLR